MGNSQLVTQWGKRILILLVSTLVFFATITLTAQAGDFNLGIDSNGNVTLPGGGTVSSGPLDPFGGTGPDVGQFRRGEVTIFGETIVPPGGAGGSGTGGSGGSGGTTQEPAETPNVVVGNGSFMQSLYGFVIQFFGRLMTLSAELLNAGVGTFVIGFGDVYLNDGVGVVVEATWETVRDIFNLTFIFGLVYIGMRMILFTDDSQSRQGLINLILAALLVNFSLFIIKFIIDISNSLAAVIFASFGEGTDIGSAFMNLLRMSSIITVSDLNVLGDVSSGLAFVFGSLLFIGVTAFVFAAGGILLIIRFVVLNFYLIFSPVMFLGFVFPGFMSFSKKYFSGFLRNAFMAPAYIFALYFTYRVLSSYVTGLGEGNNLAVITQGDQTAEVALAVGYYVLAIIMLVASMKVAKDMGAFGASTVMSVGSSLRKGSQAVIYRNTAGRAAKGAMNAMDRTGASNNAMGRTIRRGFDKSYKYGAGGASLAQARAQVDAEKKDIRANRIRMNQNEVSVRRGTSTTAHLAALENETATVTELNEAMEGLARNVRDMSNDERADLGVQQLTNHHVAGNLTDAHITNLESSGQYSPDEINRIRAARRQAQINIAETGFATVTETPAAGGATTRTASNSAVRAGGAAAAHQTAQRRKLVAGGNAVIGNLPAAALAQANMLPLVTPRVVEERMRNGISEADRVMLRDAVNTYITDPTTPAATTNLWNNWATSRHEGMEFFR